MVLISMFNRWRKHRFSKVSHQFTNHLLFVSFAEIHALTSPSNRGCFLTRLFDSEYKFTLSLHIPPVEAAIQATNMDDDIIEFVIAQDRKYSMDHLWFQQKDQKLMIGVSEFLRVEIGDVLRVILPQAETEVDEGGSLFSLWTADEKVSLTSPFSGVISDVNGEVEINPDLVNDSAYNDGWIILLEPHELQLNPDDKQLLENLMEHNEYVEYLAEL